MPTYVLKPTSEAIWALIVAATIAAAQFITTSAQPTDYRVWLVSLAGAVARALLGALLSAAGAAKTEVER